MNRSLLYLIMFVEGMFSVSLQYVTIKNISLYLGNTIILTTLIISFFLLFLGAGYKTGGTYSGNIKRRIALNFIGAGAFVGIGFSLIFVDLFFGGFELGLGRYNEYPYLYLIGYLFIVLATPVYLLAQIYPMSVNLLKGDERAGEKAGDLIFISTIGNFLGGIVVIILIMQFLGLSKTILITGVTLISLGLIFHRGLVSTTVSVAIISVIITLSMSSKQNLMHYDDTHFNVKYIEYGEDDNFMEHKYLIMNNLVMSSISGDLSAPYIEVVKGFLHKQSEPKSILVLGAGGFTIHFGLDDVHSFTYVDNDPSLLKYVENNFWETQLNVDFILDDARKYVQGITGVKKFDYVFVDIYGGSRDVPEHIRSFEFLKSLGGVLNDGGQVLLNIIHKSETDRFDLMTNRTINLAMGGCFTVSVKPAPNYMNFLYICHPHEDYTIFSDHYSSTVIGN